MSIVPLDKTNPMQKQLTALEDFDQEYTKMEMTEPETFFNVYPYRGFNGPKFRAKLLDVLMQENWSENSLANFLPFHLAIPLW